jgi:dihydroflavonol-4-reductase
MALDVSEDCAPIAEAATRAVPATGGFKLVTGGCGFIGQYLVAQLRARGDRVRVLDVAQPHNLPSDVEFVHGSILDRAILANALAGIQHVYHLAGIAQLWVRAKADLMLVNAHGTEMVLRAAREQGVERVVHCSTESILLPKSPTRDALIDEAAAPLYADMPGPYTRSKYMAEQAVLAAARNGLDVRIVNPTVPIGANDRNMTPPSAMLAMFLAGRSPAFLDCILNLVDARDVAAGMILSAERGRSGERYILGGENMSLRELLGWLELISERGMPKWALPASMAFAAGAVSEWLADRVTGRRPMVTREGVRLALRSAPFDSRKARHELGYAPRPIHKALAETLRWLSVAAPARERNLAEQPLRPSPLVARSKLGTAVGDEARRGLENEPARAERRQGRFGFGDQQ